jgi:hypothetical protein
VGLLLTSIMCTHSLDKHDLILTAGVASLDALFGVHSHLASEQVALLGFISTLFRLYLFSSYCIGTERDNGNIAQIILR